MDSALNNWPATCIKRLASGTGRTGASNEVDAMRHGRGTRRQDRIQLIGRVQLAYEQLRETMQRYHDDSPRARAAIAAAKRRLQVLNRALAMIALEAAQSPA